MLFPTKILCFKNLIFKKNVIRAVSLKRNKINNKIKIKLNLAVVIFRESVTKIKVMPDIKLIILIMLIILITPIRIYLITALL